MTHETAIDYLFKQLPNYQQQGTEAYKPGLNHIKSFCNHLGNPQDTFKSIHLAGTNGKGSTAHIIAAVLQKSGYKVGIYSSPHLIDFRERIKINGKYISEETVTQFVQENTPYCETNQISFFEWTTALAFAYFSAEKVDFAIIETGLGGRLDSTNVLRPILSIITSIGLDHTPILGTSLEEIAFEKAGIIKPKTPVLIGFLTPSLHSIFEKKATELNAPISFATETMDFRTHSDLKPAYQKNNLNLAFEACKLLIQMGYSNDFKKGIKNIVNATKFYGRWQVVSDTPKIILDCGHNAEGIEACIAELNQFKGKKRIVFGTVKDKDHGAILGLLPKDTPYYFCCPSNHRGMPADQLQTAAGFHNLPGDSYPTVSAAVQEAIDTSQPNDVILITGSTFIVADALKEF